MIFLSLPAKIVLPQFFHYVYEDYYRILKLSLIFFNSTFWVGMNKNNVLQRGDFKVEELGPKAK